MYSSPAQVISWIFLSTHYSLLYIYRNSDKKGYLFKVIFMKNCLSFFIQYFLHAGVGSHLNNPVNIMQKIVFRFLQYSDRSQSILKIHSQLHERWCEFDLVVTFDLLIISTGGIYMWCVLVLPKPFDFMNILSDITHSPVSTGCYVLVIETSSAGD